MGIVAGYQNSQHSQSRPMHTPTFSKSENENMTIQVQEMLEKRAVEFAKPVVNQFVGHVFLRRKKVGQFSTE